MNVVRSSDWGLEKDVYEWKKGMISAWECCGRGKGKGNEKTDNSLTRTPKQEGGGKVGNP